MEPIDYWMTDEDWDKAGLPRGKAIRTEGVRDEPADFKWGFDPSGIPGIEMLPKSDEQLAAQVANILTAPERGVDMVNLPEHYARYTIEPIRFICENKLDFFQGNVIKYIVRHDAKNGMEDIDKVIRYAQMYKQFLLGNPDWWKSGKPEDLPHGG